MKVRSKLQQKIINDLKENEEIFVGAYESRSYKAAVALMKKYPDVFEVVYTERTQQQIDKGGVCYNTYYIARKIVPKNNEVINGNAVQNNQTY